MSSNNHTANLLKKALLIVILSLLFLTITESAEETGYIQTDKQTYMLGETIQVNVGITDIQGHKLYYEYRNFNMRYMGDYTNFSFEPRGRGLHTLILKTKNNQEIERYSLEVIAPAQPEPPEQETGEATESEKDSELASEMQEPTDTPAVSIKEAEERVHGQGLKPLKEFFKHEEDAVFEFDFSTEEEIPFQKRPSQLGTWEIPGQRMKTDIINPKGRRAEVEPEIEETDNGKFQIKIPKQRSFEPGRYSLRVEFTKDGITYVEEKQFLWGLVSLNTKKSIYKPGETAEFEIVVLNKNGHAVENASIGMKVISPDNQETEYSTNNGTIFESDEAGVYIADYLTSIEGNHTIYITAVIDGINVNFSTYFIVMQDYEFDIIRTAQSKIDPTIYDSFDVTIDIKSFTNATSIEIKEFVPVVFNVSVQDAAVIVQNETKILFFNKTLVDGRTSISYSYSVPRVWPYLYALGPAEIFYQNQTFTEARPWYVAVDPAYDMTSNSIVTGKTTVDAFGAGNSTEIEMSVTSTNNKGAWNLTIRTTDTGGSWYQIDGTCSGTDTWKVTAITAAGTVCSQGGAEVSSGTLLCDNTAAGTADQNWTIEACEGAEEGETYKINSSCVTTEDDNCVDFPDQTASISIDGPPSVASVADNGPVPATTNASFSATVTDDESDNVGITVCKTDAITNGYPGVCAASQHLCNVTGVGSGGTAGCNYTTTAAGTLDYYVFGCEAGNNFCSLSTSGSMTVSAPIVINSQQANPQFVLNGSVVNISANVTHAGAGSIDTVIARIYYPNGTSVVNYSMTNTSGSVFWNASYAVDFGVPGQYNVTIWANESGSATTTTQVNFTPILNLSKATDIVINGVLTDWSGASVVVLDDVVGDAVGGGGGAVDNEVVLLGGGDDLGNITLMAWNSTSGAYENLWSENDTSVTDIEMGGEVGDVTHDGYPDLVFMRDHSSSDGYLEVWTYNRSASSPELYKVWSGIASAGTSSTFIGDIGDFDNDTYNEILLTNYGDSRIDIWGNDTVNATSFAFNVTIKSCSGTTWAQGAGDLNNNSIPEIITQCENGNDFEIYEWNTTTKTYALIDNFAFANWKDDIECADLDRDGVDECVSCGNDYKSNVIEESGGSYSIVYSTPLAGDGNDLVQTCGVGDITNDGWPDFFDLSAQGWRIYSYNASSSSYYSVWNESEGQHFATGAGIGQIMFGDYDNDGKGEMSCRGQESPWPQRVFESDEVNATSFTNTFNLTDNPIEYDSYVMVGDLDGDGGSGGYDPNFDIANYSLANNNSYLFARIAVNGSIDFSDADKYYALYLSTNDPATGGNFTYGGGALPFKYDYRIQVNGSVCAIYNYTNASQGSCDYDNNSNTLELRANLTLINMTNETVVNITFETGGSSYDFAPDSNSFIEYGSSGGTPPGPGPDTTPPIVNINTSLDEFFTQNTQPVVNFNFTDARSGAANCTLFFGGNDLDATLNTNNNTWTDLTVNTSQSDGNYSVYVNCTDNATNEGKSSTVDMIIDNIAPAIGVEVPADDSWTGTDSPYFTFNFSDALSPSASCALWVDGAQEDVNASTTNYTSTNLSASGLGQGNHTWSVNCTDSAGNTGVMTPRNLTVDTNAPTMAPISPADNAWTSDTTPNFVFNTTDALDYRLNCILYVDAANKGSNASTMNYTDTTIISTELTEATHTWEVNCTDEAGNEGSMVDRTLYVDNTAPTVKINESMDEWFITNQQPVITFNFSDAQSPTANCTLYFGGSALNATLDLNADTETGMRVNTSQSEGNYTVYINCTDKAGKEGKSTEINVIIDTSVPSVTPSAPADNAWVNDTTPDVVFTVTDKFSDPLNCILYVDDSNEGSNASTTNNTETTITSNALSEASHTWEVNCTDDAGNEGGMALRTLYVDNTNPTVNINSSWDNVVTINQQPVISFNFTDALSGTANCTLYFGASGVNATLDSVNDSQIDMKVNTSQSDANYSVFVNCTDKAENEAKSSVLNLEIDTSVPLVYNVDNWSITSAAAKINWTTDEPANGTVIYGEDTDMTDGSQTHSTFLNNHSVSLSGLNPSTFYYYNITSCDEQLWCNISGPYNFTTDADSDSTPPNVNINTSLDEWFTTNTQPIIQFNFTDTGSPTANCTLYFGGSGLNATLNTNNDTWTDMKVNTSQSNGNFSVYVNCTDDADNEGKSGVIEIIIDTNAPTVGVELPADDNWSGTGSPYFTFNFSDALSPSANCTLWVDGSQESVNATTTNYTSTNLSASGLGEGNHTWSVNCTDSAGNTGVITPRNITVDTNAPSVSPTSPADNAWINDTTPDVVFSVTDALDYRLNCILYVDDSNEGSNSSTMNDTGTTITSNALSEASHSWEVNCTDEAGNEGGMVARTLYVDNTNPTVNINSSWDNVVTTSQQPVISFNFSDALSGTANCTLYFDASGVNATLDSVNDSQVDMKVNTSQSDANYSVFVNCTDKAENEAKSSVLNVEIDTSVPLVYNVVNWSITYNSAKINWTTDEPANGTVIYGEDTDMTDGSQTHSSFLNNHSVSLSSLSSSTFYYYNITSCDEQLLCNISGPYNFTTEAAPASMEINVTVDASNYLAGSTVNASGTFFWSNGTKIGTKNVSVKFYNTTDDVVDEKNVTTDASGNFWSNYTLLNTDEDGTWTVNVTGIWNSTNRTDENTTTFVVNKTITLMSPAAGTNVDRDDTGADEDNATLAVRLNDGSSGVNVFFKANLTDPTIDGETDIVLWNASTNSSGEISFVWNGTDNNTDKMYAGNYTWWVEASNYDLAGTRDIQLYGTLNLTFRYTAQNPNLTYEQGDTVIIDAFLGSFGPETKTQMNSTYIGAVNSTLEDPNPTAFTVVLVDPGEDEEPVRAYGKSSTTVNQEANVDPIVDPIVEESQTENNFLLNLIEKIFGKELETKTKELFTPLYASPDADMPEEIKSSVEEEKDNEHEEEVEEKGLIVKVLVAIMNFFAGIFKFIISLFSSGEVSVTGNTVLDDNSFKADDDLVVSEMSVAGAALFGGVGDNSNSSDAVVSCSGDECTKTYYLGVVNYFNGSEYLPINLSIINVSITIASREYIFGVDKGVYQAYFREQSSDVVNRPMAMVANDYVLTFSPQDFITFDPKKATANGRVGNRQQSFAVTDGDSISYPEQYGGIGTSDAFANLTYEYHSTHIKEGLVIWNQTYLRDRFESQCNAGDADIVNLVFKNVIRAYYANDSDNQTLGVFYDSDRKKFKEYGLSANDEQTTTEEIHFTDENNNTVYYIPKLYAYDANGSSILLNKTISMTDFGNLRVDILTPFSWLNNTNRTYPVVIDPTVFYNYSDSGNKAYKLGGTDFQDGATKDGADTAPSWADGWSGTLNEASSDYTNLTSDDDAYARSPATGPGKDAVYRFEFTIDEASVLLNWVYVRFNGYDNAGEVAMCYLANFTAEDWEIVFGTVPDGASDNISQNYTGNFDDIINSTSGKLALYCYGDDFDSNGNDELFADKVEVITDYTPDTTAPTVNINTSWNNTVTTDTTPGINFNFTDGASNTANCTLYINSTGYGTTNNINNYTDTTITASPALGTGRYDVWVNCTDIYNNTGKSSVINVSVDGGPVINLQSATPRFILNTSVVNISANVVQGLVGVDKVIARIYYPNGTSAVNYSMKNISGTIFWNASYAVNFGVAGIYNVTIFANETNGVSATTSPINFSPILNLTNATDIAIDGTFTDWSGASVTVVNDVVGDSGAGDTINLTMNTSYRNNPDIVVKMIEVPSPLTVNSPNTIEVTINVTNGNVAETYGLNWSVNVTLWNTTSSTLDASAWTWTTDTGFSAVHMVRAADVDGDGDVDIIVGDESPAVHILENPGGGSVAIADWTTTTRTISNNVYSVHAADVDGDGDIDILAGHVTPLILNIFENPGGGSLAIAGWNSYNTTQAGNMYALGGGDFDNDGDYDIVSSDGSNGYRIRENPGGGSINITQWNSTVLVTSIGRYLAVGDVDDDGDLDFFEVDAANDLKLFTNPGNEINISKWSKTGDYELGDTSWYAGAGDLDNDGDIDAISCTAAPQLHVHENPGNENSSNLTRWSRTSVAFGSYAAVVDFNNDGYNDIVVENGGTTVSILANPGNENSSNVSRWASSTSPVDPAGVNDLTFADLDGDGDIDIINGAGTEINVLENTGVNSTYITSGVMTFVNQTNATYTYSLTWTPTATGLYNLTAIADNTGTYTEILENNNRITIEVNVSSVGGGGGDFDIKNYSLANNNTYLFARMQVNNSLDLSDASKYYSLYISTNSSTGNQSTLGNGTLPFKYNYRAQVNGTACAVYNSTNANLGSCDFNNDSSQIELRVNMTLINTTTGDIINISFETGSTTLSYDFAPDTNSFLQYKVNVSGTGGGPGPDNTAPTVNINSSLDELFTQNTQPVVGFNFTDARSGAANCTLFFGGNDLNATLNTNNNSWTDMYVNTSQSNGNFSVYVNCTDNATNEGKSSLVDIIIDSNAPVILASSPGDNGWVSDTTPNFVFTVNDSFSGSLNCILYVDDANKGSNASTTNDTSTTITSTELTQGSHAWEINCTDDASNLGTSGAYTITVDTNPPTVGATSPDDNLWTTDTTPDFVFAVNDSIDTLLNCTLWVGGSSEAVNATTTNDTSTTFAGVSLSETNHTWTINCTDNATNTGYTAEKTLNIDNTAPTVNINLSLNNTVTSLSAPKIYFNFSDAVSGTANCTLYINDSDYNYTTDINNDTLTTLISNTTLTEGRYDIYINCTDKVGKEGKSGIINMTVDAGYVITSPPAGTKFRLETDSSKSATGYGQSGIVEILVGLDSATGNYSGIIAFNFVANIDVAKLVVDTNRSSRKSVIHNSSEIASISNVSLLIPRVIDSKNVYICPNAISIAQVNASCPSKVTIITGQTVNGMTVSEVTYDTENYYLVENVTGTGGGEGGVKLWNGTYVTDGGDTTGEWNVSLNAIAAWFYPAILNDTRNFTLSEAGANDPPTVDTVSTVSPQTPNAENVKRVEVNFTVTDTDGTGNINHSSAKAEFINGSTSRSGGCNYTVKDIDTVEYNCSVNMQYYDQAGTWAINMSIRDLADAYADNTTTEFTYGTLIYILVSPTIFGFGDLLSVGPGYTAATSNPLQIDNMGNVNLTTINITAYNLVNGSDAIGASNITVNISNSKGTSLFGGTEITIPKANVTVDDAGTDANESIFFYITIPNVRPLTYISSSNWVIEASE